MSHDPAITEYALPQPSWEPWCAAYRFGAFYLFPPPTVAARVDALRARYDQRAHAICGAHVSLTVPLPAPLTHAGADEVRSAAARAKDVLIRWGPPYRYAGVPGVVLRIEPAAALATLVRALEACSCFHQARARPHPFSPHMTVAEFVDDRRSQAILAQLQATDWTGEWTCADVVYAVPDAEFRFTERARYPFGGEL